MSAVRTRKFDRISVETKMLCMVALRIGDQEIAEYLHTGHRFEILPERGKRAGGRRSQTSNNCTNPLFSLSGRSGSMAMPKPPWQARCTPSMLLMGSCGPRGSLLSRPDFQEPLLAGGSRCAGTVAAGSRMMGWLLSRSACLRGAETLEIFRRGMGVELHGEEFALDQVRLGRLAQPDGHIGLAHGEIEFFVGDDQRDANVGG